MKIDAAEIKNRILLRDAVALYTTQEPKRNKICCPFHDEKTASFTFFDNNTYYCFGCGASGDVITFVRKLFGLTFGQAVLRLSCDFCLELSVSGMNDKNSIKSKSAIWAARKEHNERRRMAHEKYWNLFDYFLWLENNRVCCAPLSPDAMPSPLFLESLQRFERTKAELSEAEDEWRALING